MNPDRLERLQRVLASRGVASRRASEEMIRAGRIMVDGVVVTELGTKVDPETAEIRVDRRLLRPQSTRYLMINKPSGYITTTNDERGRWTVMQLIHVQERVYPVGRLDRDTEGLLLLTNDGDVANRVMHPRYGMEKEYHVRTSAMPHPRQMERLREGIKVDDRFVVPSEVRILREHRNGLDITITVHEGVFHLIRRMMDEVGIEVDRLRRWRVGPLSIQGLEVGEWRDLSTGEVRSLYEALHLDQAMVQERVEAGARRPAMVAQPPLAPLWRSTNPAVRIREEARDQRAEALADPYRLGPALRERPDRGARPDGRDARPTANDRRPGRDAAPDARDRRAAVDAGTPSRDRRPDRLAASSSGDPRFGRPFEEAPDVPDAPERRGRPASAPNAGPARGRVARDADPAHGVAPGLRGRSSGPSRGGEGDRSGRRMQDAPFANRQFNQAPRRAEVDPVVSRGAQDDADDDMSADRPKRPSDDWGITKAKERPLGRRGRVRPERTTRAARDERRGRTPAKDERRGGTERAPRPGVRSEAGKAPSWRSKGPGRPRRDDDRQADGAPAKTLRDPNAPAKRAFRPDPQGRPAGGRTRHGARPARQDARPPREERTDRRDRPGRPDLAERPERTDQPNRPQRPERRGRPADKPRRDSTDRPAGARPPARRGNRRPGRRG